ncbi:uncharacterized protein PHALS_06756 [Plasmopara halstedii]|uniref:Uncharacterized protein n=1 Tax=Plasmopara halstedii TaxID=4781 RepID=A0A0P1B4C4_PLAHL|nr:uncharacterized protein PHALS_06756 [Plasmopara halstedii]CEG48966.1 hypothetical protein PHALS_06756 [Plasmopara halstedii]|eukprot:XP_024585335.1 hypothetical protein PHALS_06756 [Plasmopara halstedii]
MSPDRAKLPVSLPIGLKETTLFGRLLAQVLFEYAYIQGIQIIVWRSGVKWCYISRIHGFEPELIFRQ